MAKAPKLNPRLAYEIFLREAVPMRRDHWLISNLALPSVEQIQNDLFDLEGKEVGDGRAQELRRLRDELKRRQQRKPTTLQTIRLLCGYSDFRMPRRGMLFPDS